jgi:hypothetical protein
MLFGLLFLIAAGPAAARQSSDDESSAECEDVDAVGFADLLQLADDLDEQITEDLPDQGRYYPGSLIETMEVEEDDLSDVQETLDILVACVNADDPMRVAALLSERFLAEIALELLEGSDRMAALADELPILVGQFDGGESMEAIQIEAAVYDPASDDTILAVLDPDVPNLEDQSKLVVRFVNEDRLWQIDEVWLLAEV